MPLPTAYAPIISNHASQVALVNDIYDGIDTAKTHILQYEKESPEGYKQRLELSRLTNFTAMAIDSIAQIIMRKPITTDEVPEPIKSYLDSVDFQNNIDRFATNIIYSTAKDGFTFVLVDKDGVAEAVTKADVEGIRPYLVHIKRDRVRSFKEDTHGNITSFVYDESYAVDTGFVDEYKIQQRAFRFVDDLVVSEIYRDGELYSQAVSDLDYIPIVKFEDDVIPRFYDLARINKNHLNLKSENRENLRKLIIIPVIWDGGGNSDKLQVSTTTGIKFTGAPSECDFQYRSPDGSFLQVQDKAIQDEETAARMHIAELFEGSNKTATEVEIMNTKNDAVLNLFATLVEDGLNQCLAIMGDYQNVTFTASVRLNRDFLSNKLTEGQITQIRNDYIAGSISHEFYLQTMVKGEVYELTEDEIKQQVERAVI